MKGMAELGRRLEDRVGVGIIRLWDKLKPGELEPREREEKPN